MAGRVLIFDSRNSSTFYSQPHLFAMNRTNPMSFVKAVTVATGAMLSGYPTAGAAVLYSENFDSVTLGPNIEEGITTGSGERGARPFVWTETPPTGWTIDDSGMQGLGSSATDGVVEWAGWSFTDPGWWMNTAGNQNRSRFVKGGGAIAVTDPDEWDDLTRQGPYNSFLISPAINVAGAGQDLLVRFDSSWRPEAPQKAIIQASWDGAAYTEVLRWEGDSASTFFHPDSENETVSLALSAPPGASTLRLKFGTIDAGNNWWWAVDNLVVYTGTQPPLFDQQPAAQTTVRSFFASEAGAPFELNVLLNPDTEPAALQWFRQTGATRTLLAGQNTTNLTIPALELADDGIYYCEATNDAGTTRSGTVRLDVVEFAIITQPAGQTVAAGSSVSLSTSASGLGALSYQWFRGTGAEKTLVPTATTDTFTIPVAVVADSGIYSVRISTGTSTTWSNEVTLTVLPLIFEVVPQSVITDEGGMADFSVSASGTGITYQWFFRSPGGTRTAVSGAVSDVLSINPATRFGGGYYSVTATNTFGTVDSPEAKLTVNALPATSVLFTEGWDSVVLGPNVEEGITTGSGGAKEMVWSANAPAGWAVDNSAMPQPTPGNEAASDGVREWFGWTFAEPTWWTATAGNQGRSGFTAGIAPPESGLPSIIAVADPDEWDDLTHNSGSFKSILTSPQVNIASALPGTVVLTFDSSWQREAPQKAKVEVSFNSGAWQEVLLWTADGADRHEDAVNENVRLGLNNPVGGTQLQFRFTIFDAGNNWWWALDNISVSANTVAPIEMTSFTVDAPTRVLSFQWKSTVGQTFKVQYSPTMSGWLDAKTGISAAVGAGTTTTTVDLDDLFPAAPIPGRLYFRVSE